MNTNIEFYEAFAASYAAFYAGVDVPETVRQWIILLEREGLVPSSLSRENLKPKLLDVGCGHGWHLRPWQEVGFQVSGLDASPAMLRQAAHNAPGVPLYCADVLDTTSLSPLEKRFNIAVGHLNFLNLFSPDDVPLIFKSLALVLSPGGIWATDLTMDVGPLECHASAFRGSKEVSLLHRQRGKIRGSYHVIWDIGGVQLEERYWVHPIEVVESAAKAAQFSSIRFFPWSPECSLNPWSDRAIGGQALMLAYRGEPLF